MISVRLVRTATVPGAVLSVASLVAVVSVVSMVSMTFAGSMSVLAPVAAIGPPPATALASCGWRPEELALPADTPRGTVTAGGGDWLAGVAVPEDAGLPGQGVLWRDGELVALGAAFGLDTRLRAVNADGVAVGHVLGPDGYRHAIRHRGGGFEYLPETTGGSTAVDVNQRGDVVGFQGGVPVVWQTDGAVRALGLSAVESPHGSPAIDDDGRVVMWVGAFDTTSTVHRRGYVWAPDGTRTPFPAPAGGGVEVEVRDVRDGVVVGSSGTRHGERTAARWTLDGRPGDTYPDGTVAVAVNRHGTVAGADEAFGAALVWAPGELPAVLAMPAGHDPGEVTAINDDEVGGYSFPGDDVGSRPVRWVCS